MERSIDLELHVSCSRRARVSWRFGVIYARKFEKNAKIYTAWRMKTPKIQTLAYTYAIKWSPGVQSHSRCIALSPFTIVITVHWIWIQAINLIDLLVLVDYSIHTAHGVQKVTTH